MAPHYETVGRVMNVQPCRTTSDPEPWRERCLA
jgi:hypothetical protein